jgi:hypothetical protein
MFRTGPFATGAHLQAAFAPARAGEFRDLGHALDASDIT